MLERVQGTIMGTAIGDALGMPIEGFKPKKIIELYGRITQLEEPKQKNPYHKLHRGQWTDDTQLMIAITKSLIEKKCIDYDDIAEKHIEKQYDPRGWGKATTKSINRIKNGTKWWKSGEPNAAGNGPPMKIAPLGILYGLNAISKFELFTAVINISRMTHKDPRAASAAMLQSWLVSNAIRRGVKGLKFALEFAGYECLNYESSIGPKNDTLCSVIRYDNLENPGIIEASKESDSKIREIFGTGAFVNKSVPFTYSMVYKYLNNPKDGLLNIINQGGDSDTTGAMAGALFGAAYGLHIFPKEFTIYLEDREKLIKLGEHLFQIFRGV